MSYIIAEIINLAIAGGLTYLISKIDDPSGDGVLGLTMLTWLGAAVVSIIIFSLAIASWLGSWWFAIPIGFGLLFLGEQWIRRH